MVFMAGNIPLNSVIHHRKSGNVREPRDPVYGTGAQVQFRCFRLVAGLDGCVGLGDKTLTDGEEGLGVRWGVGVVAAFLGGCVSMV